MALALDKALYIAKKMMLNGVIALGDSAMTIRTTLLAAVAALALATPAAAQTTHAGHGDAHASTQAHGAHQHADFESGRFHVRVEGQGPDVILIPGLTSHPEVWDDLVAHLGPNYRIHRLHVQGFAGSDPEDNADGPVSAPVAEDLARYIAEQGIEAPTVIGHSMGGSIAMMLAARHPQAVGKLVVVDMVPFMGVMFGPPGTTAEQVRPTADMVRQGMIGSTPEQWSASGRQSITGMVRTESKREIAFRHSDQTNQTVAANAMYELITTDLRPELANIAAPTTVLYVAFEAPGMTPEISDQVYRLSFANLPGATLKRIDDSAHFIMWDQPEVFHAEIDAVLGK